MKQSKEKQTGVRHAPVDSRVNSVLSTDLLSKITFEGLTKKFFDSNRVTKLVIQRECRRD